MRKVVSANDRYEIDEDGNVYVRSTGRVLKHRIRFGYHYVVLCRGKEKKWYRVHRLVAIAFIPNPENKPEVNHDDGNKDHNYADNLTWMTPSENLRHAYATFLRY